MHKIKTQLTLFLMKIYSTQYRSLILIMPMFDLMFLIVSHIMIMINWALFKLFSDKNKKDSTQTFVLNDSNNWSHIVWPLTILLKMLVDLHEKSFSLIAKSCFRQFSGLYTVAWRECWSFYQRTQFYAECIDFSHLCVFQY